MIAIIFANEAQSNNLDPVYTKVYGLTVIERSLHALQRAEIQKAIVIAGGESSKMSALVDNKKPKELEVNVVSQLPADFSFSESLIVFQQPLVIAPNAIKKMMEAAAAGPSKIYQSSDSNIHVIGKDALGNVNGGNLKESLSFIKASSTIDLSGEICTPIHTKEQLKVTKKALIKSLTKSTDGWVSRNLNRPISTAFSRILAHTSVTPNQFTVFTGLIGLATGWFMAQGGYMNWLIGAFLFHMTSVMDGVDGELARLKFKSSPFGQWLDTVVDNLSYVVGLGGLIIGVYRNGWTPAVQIAGIAAVVFAALALISLYLYLVRFGKGGTLLNVEYSFQEGNSTFDKIMRVAAAFGKRDLFALIFLGLGIIGQLPMALAYVAIMAAAVFGFSLQAHATASKKRKSQ